MNRLMKVVVGVSVLAVAGVAGASPVVIQPNEAASKDTWIYAFNPVRGNNYNGNGFESVLASGKAILNGLSHELRTAIQFDVAGQAVAANETASLNLYVSDASQFASFVTNPTPDAPAVIDAFPILSAWVEGDGTPNAAGLNWNNQPSIGGTPVATATITGINTWASWDITAAVQGWINDPSSNNGLMLVQRSIVVNPADNKQVNAAYIGAGFAPVPSLRPFLQIAPIPEPATLSLLVLAGGLLARRR